MPKIESVSVAVARVPLDRPTSFSTRTVSERHFCLVKVRSGDGVEGIGFCYVGSGAGAIAKVAVEQLLAPVLLGQETLGAARASGARCTARRCCRAAPAA